MSIDARCPSIKDHWAHHVVDEKTGRCVRCCEKLQPTREEALEARIQALEDEVVTLRSLVERHEDLLEAHEGLLVSDGK